MVGFGPAGMFSAYILALAGLKPIVIERGSKVAKRIKDIDEFFETGKPPVSPEETIDVIAICSAGKEALLNPFKWIEL